MVFDPVEELKTTLADRYRIIEEAGKGGMATVYRAEDVKHGREVAIKVLSPDLSYTIGADRFTREIHVAARLQHPHILPVFDSGQAGGLLYYVMPFVTGESLRHRIDRESQLQVEDALAVVMEVAGALGYAHTKGVVHRDIKPENILIEQGHAVVADFGIARAAADSGEKLTATGMSVGTAQYMAPEQFAGEEADSRSDIYSLGCVMYEMLVGDVPFTGKNMMQIMARASMEQVPLISVVRPSIPGEIEEAIYRALEKTPADRFQTMEEFRIALTTASGHTGAWMRTRSHTSRYQAAAPVEMTPAKRPWYRTTPALVAASVVLLAATGVGTAIALKGPSSGSVMQAGNPVQAGKVAVLYFQEPAGDSLRFLGDALTEGLIDQLTDAGGLQVMSRAAVDSFRGTALDIGNVPAIAAKLRVGSVVHGTLEPEGNGVKVRVALVDASGDEFEGKTFRYPSADLLGLRDTVTKQVAEFLRKRLGAEVTLRESRSRTSNLDAWTLVQRAERRRKDSRRLFIADSAPAAFAALNDADSLLRVAERLDPRWPDAPAAHARLEHLRARALRADRDEARAAVDSGVAHAERALTLNPRHAEALEMRGSLRYLRIQLRLIEGDAAAAMLDSAEQDLLAAVGVRPQQATAWSTLSSLYYLKPDIAEARNAALQAYRADEYLANTEEILTRLFWTNYDQELFAEAKRWCIDEGQARFPTNTFFYHCQGWLQAAPKGVHVDPDLAWRLRDSVVKYTQPQLREFNIKRAEILVAGSLARFGLPDSARKVLLRARQGARQADPERELLGDEAVIRVILGDRTEAVKLIKEYLTANPGHRGGFASGTNWWWRDIQSDPEFRRLVQASR